MWRETYDAALRESADDGGGCAAEKLLAALNSHVDIRAADAVAVKTQLRAIGQELLRPARDVLTVDSKTPRNEKLSVFKLQVVCRLLLCCQDCVFDGEEDKPVKPRSRGKTKGNSKKSKKASEEKASVRSELRELLDRIALLIDSANPPSIADSEDEPSPFHAFLINLLEKQFGFLLPNVFTWIREVYELTEDKEFVKPSVTLSTISTKDATPTTQEAPVADSSSILSALKVERPSKKRSLAATSDAFKEMVMPGQLKKSTPTKQHARKHEVTPSVTKERAERNPVPSKPTKRRASDSSLMSLAAASKKSKPGRPSNSLLPKAIAMPMLVRNVDRQMLPTREAISSGAALVSSVKSHGVASSSRPVPSARGSAPSTAQLSRASVVMRTPDRPQRKQRSQARILVAASPPLRNPFATGSLRRPGPQMPK